MAKPNETEIILGHATPEDVKKTVEAASNEGWKNISVHRALAQYAYDPEGWIVAKDKLTNRTIGYSAASKFSTASAASVGYVIVEPEYRGRGIGSKLVNKWLDYLQDMNSVMLFSSEQGYPIYQRRGFVNIARGATGYALVATRGTKTKITEGINSHSTKLVPLNEEIFDDLVIFDTQIHICCSREKFLRSFLLPEKVTTIVALKGETIEGYGCVDKMHGDFYCIGPVYAKRYDVARALFTSLITHVPDDEKVFFYAYENNKAMKELALFCNAEVRDTIYCMVKGPKINVNLDDVYCIFDVDFGLV